MRSNEETIKIKTCQTILGLLPDKKYTINDLKKKYRIAALKHHPDKHFNSNESTAKFKEINEAYLYLHGVYSTETDTTFNHSHSNDNEWENEYEYCYSKLFSKFVTSLMNKFSNTQIAGLHIVIQILMNKCATLTSSVFNNMDCESLLFIHDLILKYSSILEIGADRLKIIHELIKKKLQEHDVIIIQPTISELFSENNIQIIEHEKQIYYVPLWHTELYYELNNGIETKKKRELVVKCIPSLPEHIYIDEINNIYIHVRTRVENIFNQTNITIMLTESISFDIPVNMLTFKTHQTIVLKHCGIPMINTENMYDITEKMNIVVHLEIII
jgi:hypothetical protein